MHHTNNSKTRHNAAKGLVTCALIKLASRNAWQREGGRGGGAVGGWVCGCRGRVSPTGSLTPLLTRICVGSGRAAHLLSPCNCAAAPPQHLPKNKYEPGRSLVCAGQVDDSDSSSYSSSGLRDTEDKPVNGMKNAPLHASFSQDSGILKTNLRATMKQVLRPPPFLLSPSPLHDSEILQTNLRARNETHTASSSSFSSFSSS